jgi:uncharacterized protein (UPF0332 family)
MSKAVLFRAEGKGRLVHGRNNREFVRAGVFDRELSSWLHKAFDMRLSADYAERVAIPQQEAENVLRQAETFVTRVKTHLSRELDDSSLAENPGDAES